MTLVDKLCALPDCRDMVVRPDMQNVFLPEPLLKSKRRDKGLRTRLESYIGFGTKFKGARGENGRDGEDWGASEFPLCKQQASVAGRLSGTFGRKYILAGSSVPLLLPDARPHGSSVEREIIVCSSQGTRGVGSLGEKRSDQKEGQCPRAKWTSSRTALLIKRPFRTLARTRPVSKLVDNREKDKTSSRRSYI